MTCPHRHSPIQKLRASIWLAFPAVYTDIVLTIKMGAAKPLLRFSRQVNLGCPVSWPSALLEQP